MPHTDIHLNRVDACSRCVAMGMGVWGSDTHPLLPHSVWYLQNLKAQLEECKVITHKVVGLNFTNATIISSWNHNELFARHCDVPPEGTFVSWQYVVIQAKYTSYGAQYPNSSPPYPDTSFLEEKHRCMGTTHPVKLSNSHWSEPLRPRMVPINIMSITAKY